MENKIKSKDAIIRTNVKTIMTQFLLMAERILPNENNYDDPMEKMMCSFGSIPDTYEWVRLKVSCIDYEYMELSELVQIQDEWTEYIMPKVKAYMMKNGIEIPAQKED